MGKGREGRAHSHHTLLPIPKSPCIHRSNPFSSPQSIILKQRRDAELKAAAEKLAADMAAATKTQREEMIKRSEKYEKEYKQVGLEHSCDV